MFIHLSILIIIVVVDEEYQYLSIFKAIQVL